MTSSSTEPELTPEQQEIEDLKVKVAVLQAEIAALRASWPVFNPYIHVYPMPGAAPAPGPWVQIHPGTAPMSYTIPIQTQAAAPQPWLWQTHTPAVSSTSPN